MVIIGTTEKWSPARITDIFVAQLSHQGKLGVFLAVEVYCPLSHKQAQHDKFLQYPLAGRLFLDRISETSVVRAEQILCHYAATPMRVDQIGADCLHVLPLLRVSPRCLCLICIVLTAVGSEMSSINSGTLCNFLVRFAMPMRLCHFRVGPLN